MQNDSIEVHLRGSTGTPYVATFVRTGNVLHTTCSCPAGEKRTHCKHRLHLLGGNLSSVTEPMTEDLAKRLFSVLQGTSVQSAIEAMAFAEDEARGSADRLKRAKKNLDRVMHP